MKKWINVGHMPTIFRILLQYLVTPTIFRIFVMSFYWFIIMFFISSKILDWFKNKYLIYVS